MIDIGTDEYYPTTGVHIYIDADDICIFPNPFQDMVNVAGDLGTFDIQVLDAAGNLVTDYTGSNSPLTIDLTALGPGMYFLSVQSMSINDQSIFVTIKE